MEVATTPVAGSPVLWPVEGNWGWIWDCHWARSDRRASARDNRPRAWSRGGQDVVEDDVVEEEEEEEEGEGGGGRGRGGGGEDEGSSPVVAVGIRVGRPV